MNGGLSAEVDYGAAISPVDCANIVRSGRSTRDGHERGRDKLSDKALRRAAGSRERPTSNRCLGLSGRRRPRWDCGRGVRAHACARFGLLAPHACRPAVSGVYPRTSASRHERPFAYHISGEACSWLGLLWLGTRKSLHVLHPAGGCDIARDPANWPPTGSESRHIGQGRCGGIQSSSIAARFRPVRLVPISAIPLSGVGARHAFVPRQPVQKSCRKANGKGDSALWPPRIVVRSGRHNLPVEHQGRAVRLLHGIQRVSIVAESGHVEHDRVLLAGDVRTEDP